MRLTRPLSKRRLFFWLLGIACVLAFGWGSYYHSRHQVLERYIKARQQEGDMMSLLKPYLVWADTEDYISMEEGRLAALPRLSQEEADALRQQLSQATPEDSSYLTSIGSKFWLFPDYRVAMQPMSLTLTTNLPEASLLLNGRQVAVSDSEDFQVTVDRLVPSIYEASLEGRHEGKPVTVSKTYDGKSQTLDLRVAFKTFSVTSNLEGANLYLGDKAVGTIQEGRYALEDYPVPEGLEVYVKRSFSDGDLVSKKVALDQVETGEELDLSVSGLLTQEEASPYLLTAFDSLLVYYTSGQDQVDAFEKGSQNSFYQLLKTSIERKTRTDSRLATSFAIPSLYVTDFQQVGKTSYALSFGGRYDYYYDKSTDKNKSSGYIYQQISGNLILTKSGETYKIADKGAVLNLDSEDNQVKLPPTFKSKAGLPTGLAGVWELHREDLGMYLFATIHKDGRVETVFVDPDDPGSSQTRTAQIKSHKVISDGLYALEFSGDAVALGYTGLGGAGVQYAAGLLVSGDQLTSLVWTAPASESLDYEAAYSTGPTWQKSSSDRLKEALKARASSSSGQSESSSSASASSDSQPSDETDSSSEPETATEAGDS